MKKTRRDRTETAAETYAERTREIEGLLESIGARLQLHEGNFRDRERVDWGYVGDLGNAIEHLRHALAAIGGR